MKRFSVLIVAAFIGLSMANAQSNAIGLRFNAGDGSGVEFSYQRTLGNANRLELGLGLDGHEYYNWFRFTALYQWVWDLSELAPGFNWYAGVGGGLYSWSYKSNWKKDNDNYVGLGVLGNIGIEYNFDFPLQLSLDLRPGFHFFDGGNDFGFGGVALGVRYKF